MRKQAMAAQFTEVTLEEMEKFLKRGWRSLRPKQGTERGELYYDLSLSDHVVIRVWTSIHARQETGAGVGQDAIRVQFFSKTLKRPIMKGKAPIVKRTQGWRNNLQDRIEDYIQEYESKDDYWESLASGGRARQEAAPPPPQESRWEEDPEIDQFEQEVEQSEKNLDRYERALRVQQRTPKRPGEDPLEYFMRVRELAGWTKAEIRESLEGEAEVNDYERGRRDFRPPTPAGPSRGPLKATYSKYRGDWCLRILGAAAPGDRVIATRASGQSQSFTIETVLWKGQDRDTGQTITLAAIPRTRNASGDEVEEDFGSYERV